MAKLTPVILDEDPNEFGTWNVKIRIGHKSRSAYLATDEYVGKKNIKDGVIKPSFIISNLTGILTKYNNILNEFKQSLPTLSHLQVKELLENNGVLDKVNEEIMFLKASKEYIDSMEVENTAAALRTVYLRVNDYLQGCDIPVRTITASFLKEYDRYIRKPAVLRRMRMGVLMDTSVDGLGNTGVCGQMKRLQRLFNEIKDKYNDEESGIIPIPNDPFRKYKFPEPDDVPDRDYTVDQIVKIRDCILKEGSRVEMARDLWMLSFYLGGMNAADMLRLSDKEVVRVEYNRKKTESQRTDKAFISIKLIDEAKDIYRKYAGKLQSMYANGGSFNNAISEGIKRLRKILGKGFEELDFYSARHSVATIAANECGYSVEAIGRILNHGEKKGNVTNRYIRRSWKIVDDIQESVVSLIRNHTIDSIT